MPMHRGETHVESRQSGLLLQRPVFADNKLDSTLLSSPGLQHQAKLLLWPRSQNQSAQVMSPDYARQQSASSISHFHGTFHQSVRLLNLRSSKNWREGTVNDSDGKPVRP